jgi:hypothetical protein
MRGVGGPKTLPTLLITNYRQSRKSLASDDRWDLGEVEVIDLGPHAAEALLAMGAASTVLAKALEDQKGSSPPTKSTLQRLRALAASLPESAATPAPAEAVEILLRAAELPPALRPLGEEAMELGKAAQAGLGGADNPPEGAAPALPRASLAKAVRLVKTEEERFVFGIVLEPETVDAQQDIYSAGEVRDAAHRFLEDYGNVGLMHQGLVNDKVKIRESYVAPVGFDLAGTSVKKGTWLLGVHILDDKLWAQVQAGELGGFSIGGSAQRSAE